MGARSQNLILAAHIRHGALAPTLAPTLLTAIATAAGQLASMQVMHHQHADDLELP